MLCEDARGEAFQTWAALIKVAREGSVERNLQGTMVADLLKEFLTCASKFFTNEQDAESLCSVAEGLSECVKNAGQGSLTQAEVLPMTQQLFVQIDASFSRTEE